MRDYAERVKALRCCSKIDARNNGCDSCPYEYCGEDCQNLCGNAADAIEELLAAVPETAFWVDTQPHLDDSSYKKDGMAYYCSNCHHRAGKYKHRSYKFCPWCGARIVPKDAAIADMLPPLQNGEDKADLIEQMERFQEYAKGGSK